MKATLPIDSSLPAAIRIRNYVENAGGRVKVSDLYEDWEPVGIQMLRDATLDGEVKTEHGWVVPTVHKLEPIPNPKPIKKFKPRFRK